MKPAPDLPRALTLYQPWAWLVANGWKDAENRPRVCNLRGPTLIHAARSQGKDRDWNEMQKLQLMLRETRRFDKALADKIRDALPDWTTLERGGIVGIADFTGDTRTDEGIKRSRWFLGPQAYSLGDAMPLEFEPCRGFQGVWFYQGQKHADAALVLKKQARAKFSTDTTWKPCDACLAYETRHGFTPLLHFLVACTCRPAKDEAPT